MLTGGGGLAGFRRDIQDWAGSASIKHKPTGLFVMGAFSFSDNDDSNTKHAGIFTGTSDPQMSAGDIEFGIQRGVPWFNLDKLGETSVFGSISNIHNGLGAGTGLGRIGPTRFLPAGTFDNVTVGAEITGADVDRWAVGVEQALDSANMHLYAVYQHFTADVDLVDASLNHVAAPLDDFQLFYAGARICF